MQRRNFLKSAMSLPLLAAADEKVARAATGMPSPKIKDISVIECEPAGVRLTVVKVTTDQDGLYGYGCATFTQRADLVRPAVEKISEAAASRASGRSHRRCLAVLLRQLVLEEWWCPQ